MKKQTKTYSNNLLIEFSGLIEYGYSYGMEILPSFQKIKLLQPNNYKIDLISRFEEINESFNYQCKVKANYWISKFYKDSSIYPLLNSEKKVIEIKKPLQK